MALDLGEPTGLEDDSDAALKEHLDGAGTAKLDAAAERHIDAYLAQWEGELRKALRERDEMGEEDNED
jgi:hypothetical protein